MQNLDEAYRMLDAFASVGAQRFDVTFLDIEGKKRGFRKGQTLAQLRNSLPKLLPGLTERRNSLVIRPENHFRGLTEMVTLVQLDDLDATAFERLKDVAFLTLQTSPGNHQAWVAVRPTSMRSQTSHCRRRQTDRHRPPSAQRASAPTLSSEATCRRHIEFREKYEPDFPTNVTPCHDAPS